MIVTAKLFSLLFLLAAWLWLASTVGGSLLFDRGEVRRRIVRQGKIAAMILLGLTGLWVVCAIAF